MEIVRSLLFGISSNPPTDPQLVSSRLRELRLFTSSDAYRTLDRLSLASFCTTLATLHSSAHLLHPSQWESLLSSVCDVSRFVPSFVNDVAGRMQKDLEGNSGVTQLKASLVLLMMMGRRRVVFMKSHLQDAVALCGKLLSPAASVDVDVEARFLVWTALEAVSSMAAEQKEISKLLHSLVDQNRDDPRHKHFIGIVSRLLLEDSHKRALPGASLSVQASVVAAQWSLQAHEHLKHHPNLLKPAAGSGMQETGEGSDEDLVAVQAAHGKTSKKRQIAAVFQGIVKKASTVAKPSMKSFDSAVAGLLHDDIIEVVNCMQPELLRIDVISAQVCNTLFRPQEYRSSYPNPWLRLDPARYRIFFPYVTRSILDPQTSPANQFVLLCSMAAQLAIVQQLLTPEQSLSLVLSLLPSRTETVRTLSASLAAKICDPCDLATRLIASIRAERLNLLESGTDTGPGSGLANHHPHERQQKQQPRGTSAGVAPGERTFPVSLHGFVLGLCRCLDLVESDRLDVLLAATEILSLLMPKDPAFSNEKAMLFNCSFLMIAKLAHFRPMLTTVLEPLCAELWSQFASVSPETGHIGYLRACASFVQSLTVYGVAESGLSFFVADLLEHCLSARRRGKSVSTDLLTCACVEYLLRLQVAGTLKLLLEFAINTMRAYPSLIAEDDRFDSLRAFDDVALTFGIFFLREREISLSLHVVAHALTATQASEWKSPSLLLPESTTLRLLLLVVAAADHSKQIRWPFDRIFDSSQTPLLVAQQLVLSVPSIPETLLRTLVGDTKEGDVRDVQQQCLQPAIRLLCRLSLEDCLTGMIQLGHELKENPSADLVLFCSALDAVVGEAAATEQLFETWSIPIVAVLADFLRNQLFASQMSPVFLSLANIFDASMTPDLLAVAVRTVVPALENRQDAAACRLLEVICKHTFLLDPMSLVSTRYPESAPRTLFRLILTHVRARKLSPPSDAIVATMNFLWRREDPLLLEFLDAFLLRESFHHRDDEAADSAGVRRSILQGFDVGSICVACCLHERFDLLGAVLAAWGIDAASLQLASLVRFLLAKSSDMESATSGAASSSRADASGTAPAATASALPGTSSYPFAVALVSSASIGDGGRPAAAAAAAAASSGSALSGTAGRFGAGSNTKVGDDEDLNEDGEAAPEGSLESPEDGVVSVGEGKSSAPDPFSGQLTAGGASGVSEQPVSATVTPLTAMQKSSALEALKRAFFEQPQSLAQLSQLSIHDICRSVCMFAISHSDASGCALQALVSVFSVFVHVKDEQNFSVLCEFPLQIWSICKAYLPTKASSHSQIASWGAFLRFVLTFCDDIFATSGTIQFYTWCEQASESLADPQSKALLGFVGSPWASYLRRMQLGAALAGVARRLPSAYRHPESLASFFWSCLRYEDVYWSFFDLLSTFDLSVLQNLEAWMVGGLLELRGVGQSPADVLDLLERAVALPETWHHAADLSVESLLWIVDACGTREDYRDAADILCLALSQPQDCPAAVVTLACRLWSSVVALDVDHPLGMALLRCAVRRPLPVTDLRLLLQTMVHAAPSYGRELLTAQEQAKLLAGSLRSESVRKLSDSLKEVLASASVLLQDRMRDAVGSILLDKPCNEVSVDEICLLASVDERLAALALEKRASLLRDAPSLSAWIDDVSQLLRLSQPVLALQLLEGMVGYRPAAGLVAQGGIHGSAARVLDQLSLTPLAGQLLLLIALLLPKDSEDRRDYVRALVDLLARLVPTNPECAIEVIQKLGTAPSLRSEYVAAVSSLTEREKEALRRAVSTHRQQADE